MAVTFEELIGRVSIVGADKAQRDVKRVREEVGSLGEALQEIGTIGGITYLFGQIGEVMRSLTAVSGTALAAQFGSADYTLRSLLGNTQRYRDLLRDIKGMGGDKVVMSRVAAQMVAGGVPAEQVGGDLTKLRDSVAAGGGKPSDLQDILFNVLQIRAMQGQRADFQDIREMFTRAPGMSRVLAAGMGVNQGDVMGKLREGMTGSQVYAALLKGASAQGIAGAAKRAEAEDPLQSWEALMRDFKQIMVPTGELLLQTFRPVAWVAKQLAGALKDINERSGGLFGLAGLIGGGLWVATRTATTALWGLVTALTATAGAAGVAGGAAATAGSAAMIGPGATAAAGAVGIGATIRGLLPKLLRGAGIAAMIAGAGSIIGSLIEGDGSNKQRKMGGGLIKDMSMGLGIGAGIGGIAGGLPGAFIGAGIGLISGMLYNLIAPMIDKGGKGTVNSTDAQIANNTAKMAATLEEIKARMYGGGERSASALSGYIAEYQIAKALAL